jgi:hypothetical protein
MYNVNTSSSHLVQSQARDKLDRNIEEIPSIKIAVHRNGNVDSS